MKKWILWTGLGLLGAGAIAGTTAGIVIATRDNSNYTKIFEKSFHAFNPKVANKTKNEGYTFDLNPETNTSSTIAYKKLIKSIVKDKFQTEISQNLQQFYEAYELENENGSFEFEAEIENIKVKDADYFAEFNENTPFGKWVLTADVKYGLEEERNDFEKEWFETKEKKITLIPSLAGQKEIDLIIKQLNHYHGYAQDVVEDLRELYFGDRDYEGWSYSLNSRIDWEDSRGVLTYLGGFINNVNPYAKMSGWKINISELVYSNSTKATPDPTKELWTPSAINTAIYYPDVNADGSIDPDFSKPVDGGLNWEQYSLAWNMGILRVTTINQFKSDLGIKGISGTSLNIDKLSKYGIKLPGNITSWRWEEDLTEIDLTIKTDKNSTFKFELEKSWFKKA